MSQENRVHVPQALLDSFAGYGLELPPLPLASLGRLSPARDNLFATSALPAWITRNTPTRISYADLEKLGAAPADMEAEDRNPDGAGADPTAGETTVSGGNAPYFLCGFDGHGLQGRFFIYLYAAERLRIGICIPFDHAYADPEREREEFARVMELLALLLQCTKEGTSLTVDGPGTLYWSYDWHGSSFQVRDGGGETILEGSSVGALLDYLECCRAGYDENSSPTQSWVKV